MLRRLAVFKAEDIEVLKRQRDKRIGVLPSVMLHLQTAYDD